MILTSSSNAEAELEYNSAEIAAETGLVRAVDGNDAGLPRSLRHLDLHHVLARHPHLQRSIPPASARRRLLPLAPLIPFKIAPLPPLSREYF